MERSQRVAEEIRKIMSEAIRKEIKDPRLPMMSTVTEVKVNRDLSLATIYVSTLGGEDKKKDMMLCLDKAKGFLRSKLARELGLRVAPEIRFHLDESIEIGMRMSQLIDKVIAEDESKSEQFKDRG